MNRWSKEELINELQRVTRSVVPCTEEWKEYVYILCAAISKIVVANSKYCDNNTEVDELATVVAETLYIRIVNDEAPIESIAAYVSSILPSCCAEWLKLNGWEKPQPRSAHIYYDPEHPRRIAPSLTTEIVDKVFTGESLKLAWDSLHKFLRYYKWKDSVTSRNAHLSVMLSIRHNKFINYHLDEVEAKICRLIYNRYRLLLHDIFYAVNDSVMSDSDYFQQVFGAICDINGISREE